MNCSEKEIKHSEQGTSKGCTLSFEDAEQMWFDSKVNNLKNGSQHPKQYWDAVHNLKQGNSDTKHSQKKLIRLSCMDTAENQEAVCSFFSKDFNIPSSC
mmetsp:Transcript_71964/g.192196  ORF Transcript_71964/g.192196 Transcript_71964/m.192196 type:complete len:99 (-) Transcript_71964:1587-1883(-)